MSQQNDYVGALELLVESRDSQDRAEDERRALIEQARAQVDDARTAIARLAEPAAAIVGLRLAGVDVDWNGDRITDARYEAALTVLDRVGIPKLRATAIAPSMAAAPRSPAPGSPGWAPEAKPRDDAEAELDVGSVDAQIDAFIHGAEAVARLRRERGEGEGDAA